MWDDWMPQIRLAIPIDQFHQLPRNPAYKYEYSDGYAVLSPRPRNYHALLELQPLEVDPDITVRPLNGETFADLEDLFAAAFHNTQPFGSMDEETLKQAVHASLERTRSGGDGPLVRQACFTATLHDFERLAGAILITLLPDGDPEEMDSYYWREPAPSDLVEQRLGRPHLTWIFVAPLVVCQGIGSTLLAAAVNELLRLGYSTLCSTFLMGNHSSTLWHWRNGFRLLPGTFSHRGFKRRWKGAGDLA
jgi:GNAT superfamily N-acetyltransferase